MSDAHAENPFAGQGSVLLDIGGDVGALVVQMPDDMEGEEIEIRPLAPLAAVHDHHDGHGHGHGHDHDHDHGHGHGHHPHVAVVRRPVAGGLVASLVFGEVVEGAYGLTHKGDDRVLLRADVRGGEVTELVWPG